VARILPAPEYDAVVEDLNRVRVNGITNLRRLDLPALSSAVYACAEVEPGERVTAPAIESLLRRAISDLNGERLRFVAGLLFLLNPGSRDYAPAEARRYAAEEVGLSFHRFRREPEKRIIGQIAEMILNRIHNHRMRLQRLEEQRRTPDSTRLAVKWLERFEAYYRIWTPVYKLGADLTAYRSTLLDPDRPYDNYDNDGDEYSQEIQAKGYITTALFAHAAYLEHVRRFTISHGGLWLFSDEPAGLEISDAIYRIGWHSPNNDRDESFLTMMYRDADGDLHDFLNRLAASSIGMGLQREWQEWADECQCTWEHTEDAAEFFPTQRNHPGINNNCGLHLMVEASGDYCRLVEEDWFRLQDWYSIDSRSERGISGEELFKRYPPKM